MGMVYFYPMNKKDTVKVIGLSLGALAAAAAGTYFLFGKNAKVVKARKQVKSWSLKLKGDVLEKLENVENITEDGYYKIIDDVSKGYKAIKTIDGLELMESVNDLKKHWKDIKKDIMPKKVVKKVAKKAVTAKKVVVKKALK